MAVKGVYARGANAWATERLHLTVYQSTYVVYVT